MTASAPSRMPAVPSAPPRAQEMPGCSWMRFASDLAGERLAIDCKGTSGRHGIVKGGGVHLQAPSAANDFQHTRRAFRFRALQAVRADQLGAQTGFVHRRALFGAHFHKADREPSIPLAARPASLPARPAPMIEIRFIVSIVHLTRRCPRPPTPIRITCERTCLLAYRQPLHQPGARIPLATVLARQFVELLHT